MKCNFSREPRLDYVRWAQLVWSGKFREAQGKSLGNTCYSWNKNLLRFWTLSLRVKEKVSLYWCTDQVDYECFLILDVLLTSTLPLLVLRGVFELTSSEKRFELRMPEWKTSFVCLPSSSYSKKSSFFTTDFTSVGTLMLSNGPWGW